MTVNRFSNLLWFGALYCATQGALDSWDEAYELSYLSAYDVSVANIALAQTLGVLPMFVKGILSLPSDLARVRRIFIALGLILSGSMFIIKVTFNPNQSFWAYCLCLMLRNTGAAISDGAADGLIIDADVEALSGTISAWQGVGRMAGLILSTILGAVIIGEPATYAGFSGCLIFLGAWMLLSAPVAGIVKEELVPSPFGSRLVAACAYVSRILTLGTDKLIAKFVEEKVGPAVSSAGTTAYNAAKQALTALGLRNRADKVGEVANEVVANPLAQATAPTPVPADKVVEEARGDDVRRARLARLGLGAAQVSAPMYASENGSEGVTAPIMPHAPLHIDAPAQKEKNSDEIIPDAVVVTSPKDTPVEGTSPGADTVDPIAEALGTKEAYLLLWRHIHRTPVAAFVGKYAVGPRLRLSCDHSQEISPPTHPACSLHVLWTTVNIHLVVSGRPVASGDSRLHGWRGGLPDCCWRIWEHGGMFYCRLYLRFHQVQTSSSSLRLTALRWTLLTLPDSERQACIIRCMDLVLDRVRHAVYCAGISDATAG